jgi:hypothetical protein
MYCSKGVSAPIVYLPPSAILSAAPKRGGCGRKKGINKLGANGSGAAGLLL